MESEQAPPIDRRRKTVIWGICGLLPGIYMYLMDQPIGQAITYAVAGVFIAIAFARKYVTGEGMGNALVSQIPLVGGLLVSEMEKEPPKPEVPKEYATLAEALRDFLGESKYRKLVRELNTICLQRGMLLEWQKDAWAEFTLRYPRWEMDFEALRLQLPNPSAGPNQSG